MKSESGFTSQPFWNIYFTNFRCSHILFRWNTNKENPLSPLEFTFYTDSTSRKITLRLSWKHSCVRRGPWLADKVLWKQSWYLKKTFLSLFINKISWSMFLLKKSNYHQFWKESGSVFSIQIFHIWRYIFNIW